MFNCGQRHKLKVTPASPMHLSIEEGVPPKKQAKTGMTAAEAGREPDSREKKIGTSVLVVYSQEFANIEKALASTPKRLIPKIYKLTTSPYSQRLLLSYKNQLFHANHDLSKPSQTLMTGCCQDYTREKQRDKIKKVLIPLDNIGIDNTPLFNAKIRLLICAALCKYALCDDLIKSVKDLFRILFNSEGFRNKYS